MSKRFDFDTVLMPVNVAEIHVKPSFIEKMIPQANSKRLGIIGMKVFGQGYVFHPEGLLRLGNLFIMLYLIILILLLLGVIMSLNLKRMSLLLRCSGS